LERFKIKPRVRLALSTGFLGAYTTFSTFSVEAITLLQSREPLPAITYIAGTAFGCVFLAWAGAGISRSLVSGHKMNKSSENE
jgi:CrcB protein